LASGGFMDPGADMLDAGVRLQRTPVNLDALRDKRKKQKKDAKKQKKRNRKR
jgi:hypothetical protein